ncbi:hydrolase [Tateyamaria omphalii]|uniref:alpha/beta fold hydrolase n=1 Tax=Tateyamaria omphalii TaxID=299262 RepID=UPI0016742276|nr:alpha/beta hydrolase [Tateyamaria omphalii]GGX51787.1 hydrolase [Tateyamaria omphalii]
MSTFQTSDGLSLYFEDHGEGLPLLCLPGLTRTTQDFQYITPHLPPCRLIKLDYRGRGQSQWDENWQNYTLPVEIRDVMELMDHLSLSAVAVLGTSRGGLNAMALAATAPDRLLGAVLNDVGPELDPAGLAGIMTYLGHRPAVHSMAKAAAALPHVLKGFEGVPAERWMQEAHTHFVETKDGLDITYDPRLRDAVEAGEEMPDLWPFFDALAGKPLALIRGAGSDLLSAETARKMQDRRPDMIFAEVPGRGHVPFLDEPEALAAIRAWMEKLV